MATTQDKVKIVKTTNISNKDASIYGDDAVIFDISGGIYLGNNTKNGNKIAVSPNDLSTKLDTSGGTISNSWSSPFVLNNTSTTGEIGMKLTLAGADKGWVGYNDNYGTYLYTNTGPHRLGIKTDGNGYIDDSTILHSRNFYNYVNKFLINGIDSSVTSGSYAGIIQAHDADNNPTDGWYNRFKILHGNTNGYYTELAMPFNNTNLYYRVMSNGNLFDWRRIPFIDDVLPSTGGSISGALTLTGTTDDKAAIDFSRVGYNYITIPEGDSRLAFSVGAHSIANTKMTILTSGRVGIGTVDPASALEVVGTVKATTFLGNLNGNAGTATKLATPRSIWGQSFDGTGEVRGDLVLYGEPDDYNNGNGKSGILSFGGSYKYRGPYIQAIAGGGWGMKNLVFYQYNTQEWPGDYSKHYAAMTLDVHGRLGIGTTAPTERLQVSGNVKATKFIGPLQGNADSATNAAQLGGVAASGYAQLSGAQFTGDTAVQGVFRVNTAADNRNCLAILTEIATSVNQGMAHIGTNYGYSNMPAGFTSNIIYAMSVYRGMVGIGRSFTYAELNDAYKNGRPLTVDGSAVITGNVGIGTTTPSEKLEVSGNATINGKLTAASGAFTGEVAFNAVPSTDICSGVKASFKTSIAQISDIIGNYFYLGKEATDKYIRFRKYSSTSSYAPSGITDLMTIDTNGNVSAADFITTSDARLKDFVDDIAIDFDALKSIPKKTYYWKDKDKYGDQLEIGTSAQELMKVYPECVSYDDESDKYSVNYQKLSIVALAAIDKLHDENAELKSRLDKIEKLLNI